MLKIDKLVLKKAANENFKVYPNPSIDEINLLCTANATYQIFNMQGVLIHKGNELIKDKPYLVNITHLPAGIYNIVFNNNNKQTQQFIKL